MAVHPINYSQCWEDSRILGQAFCVGPDDVILSITSGGDNTLALLLSRPRHIVSIDVNPTQNYLLELKLAALRALSYHEALEFLGVFPLSSRNTLFKRVETLLSPAALSWWRGHAKLINQGVIHVGRFENFLRLFRRYLLPCVHSRGAVEALFTSSSLEEQRVFYDTVWNSRMWRLFFRLASSRLVLRGFARQRQMFLYTEPGAVATRYLQRMERGLTTVPLWDNYFMRYCFTGTYGLSTPPYLEEQGYNTLREETLFSRLSFVASSVTTYLRSMPSRSFSIFNLSDVFEALSPVENDALWTEILRTARDKARVVYWNNLVPRSFPLRLSSHIKDESDLARALYARDRVFFYGSFHINTVRL